MSRIFLSYRRKDSQDITDRLYDVVIKKFGKRHVFKDVDSIPHAQDFRKVIADSISESKVVVLIIGPDWCGFEDGGDEPRIKSEDDFIRIEVEAALRYRKPILPVFVRGGNMPDPNILPESIREITLINGIVVRPDPDFHRDASKLVNTLTDITPPKRIWPFVVVTLLLVSGIVYSIYRPTPSVIQVTPAPAIEKEIDIDKYYGQVYGLDGYQLKAGLSRLTRQDHRIFGQKNLNDVIRHVYEDLYDTDQLRVFYDAKMVNKEFGPGSGSEARWNKEYIWPKSFGAISSNAAKADLFNIVPADPRQNARRTNMPFSDVVRAGFYQLEPSTQGDIRGDVARILMYMAVRYEGIGGEPDLELTDSETFEAGDTKFGPLSILLGWHLADGVSINEKERNDRIYNIQGNRNPFIDRPDFAEKIWARK
ncbi:endonuclease [Pseudoalteromonas rubra]|uniref:TIR domain-containing protein n=1 Tax=Pseudoalteromonas rubra TaxID=43658 RepID=A0A5S3X211_9GAMM|nr:endonuclease [Pseudoalteromonas rubra]TMP38135.1 hypothetical protein CWB98_07395 [Pseudoalteromonas rubra]